MEDNIFKPTAIKAKETLVHNSERSSSFRLEGTHRTAPTRHWFYQYKRHYWTRTHRIRNRRSKIKKNSDLGYYITEPLVGANDIM